MATADNEFPDVLVTDRRGNERRKRQIPVATERPGNIRVLPCADLLTDSIRRIFTDDSVSEVFGGENQLF